MKRGTTDHPKMETLALLLGIPEAFAVGIMAKLWEWAAKYTPAGDVGKYANEVVAKKAGWNDDAAKLISALIHSRWLDEDEDHRLIIHDWAEHCEDSVHAQLARQGLYFATGERPKLKKLSQEERHVAEEKYAVGYAGSQRRPNSASGSQRQPAAACLNPSIPCPSLAIASANPSAESPPAPEAHQHNTSEDPSVIIRQAVAELLPNHPKMSPQGWAESAIEHEVKTKQLDAWEFCESLKKTHAEHCIQWQLDLSHNPRAFVPLFHIWVRDGYYLNRNSTKDPPKPKPSKGARLHQELAGLKAAEKGGSA